MWNYPANGNFCMWNFYGDFRKVIPVWHTVAYLGFHFGGGGGSIFYWKSGRSHAYARGGGGHAPLRKVFKIVQFGTA